VLKKDFDCACLLACLLLLTVLKKLLQYFISVRSGVNATRFKEVRVNGGSSGLTRLACWLAAVNGAKKCTAMHHISYIADCLLA
jgi:hypothetical protein